METELVELFEVAKKAADLAAADGASSDSPEVSRCVDALNQLKKFPVSMDALIATQVGKRLRFLTKHPSETIKTVASDVFELWKKIIIDETLKNKKNGSTDSSKHATTIVEKVDNNNVKVEKSQKGGGVTMKVEKVSSKAETADRAKPVAVGVSGSSSDKMRIEKKANGAERIVKEDKQSSSVKKAAASQGPAPPKLTSLVRCNDTIRDKVRELLAEALSKVTSEADQDMLEEVKKCDPLRVAVMVESVMFEKLGRSNGAQKFKYRSIMFNLKDANNPDLRRRVLIGEIQPESLITMSPDEMASDERKRENSQIKEKAMFDCERAGAPKATTDQFKCGRCGQRKTTYYQLQTRSADEPMTTFVTCVNCNNHWKFC